MTTALAQIGALTEDEEPLVGREFLVPLDQIRPFPKNPRKKFIEASLRRLGVSMKKGRQVTPAKVIVVIGDPTYKFELIDGERRWRAARLVGLKTLRCVVDRVENRLQQYKESLVANFSREDHTPLEKALGFKTLMDEDNMSQQEVADLIGISQPVVNQYLRLLDLHPTLRALLEEEDETKRLRTTVAGVLTKLAHDLQLVAWTEICKGKRSLVRANMIVDRMIKGGAERHPNSRVRTLTASDYSTRIMRFMERVAGELDEFSKIDWDQVAKAIKPSSRKKFGALFADMDTTYGNLTGQLEAAFGM